VTDNSSDNTEKHSPYILPALLTVGAVLGFTIGGIWGEHWISGDWPIFTGFLKLVGDVFMNMLKMVVLPLIVCSMIVGMASMGEQKKVGRTFGLTFAYYFLTTFLSVLLGLILVSTIQPGIGAGMEGMREAPVKEALSWYDALFNMIRGLFPSNLFEAAADGKIIGLLVFSLIFGGVVVKLGERGKQVIQLADTINEALMVLVRWIIWGAPVGVMGLVANRVGQAGGGAAVWEELARLASYFGTVLLGLSIHGLIVLPILLMVLTKRNPLTQLAHFAEPLLTAFSTASSAATLPITIQSAEENAKLSPKTSRFVLPLGATINMDGTALYEAVAAVFIAQAYGMDLSGMQLVIVLLTATLAAVGAAAIPQAGLVTMVMVLAAVNVPIEGIGLLLSVDWLLDRFRTTLNVWGDSIGAAIIDSKTGNGLRSK